MLLNFLNCMVLNLAEQEELLFLLAMHVFLIRCGSYMADGSLMLNGAMCTTTRNNVKQLVGPSSM